MLISDSFLRQLKWTEVDPDKHDFDLESALLFARSAIKNAPSGYRDWLQMVEREIDRCFIEKYGSWAAGWRFSTGEGSIGGGVVTAWCCPQHSVLCSSPDDDATQTAQHAVEGLKQWHEHLQRTKKLFEKLAPHFEDGRASALDLHSAGARIITFVADETCAEDAWYAYAEQVLSWYLESLGLDAEKATEVAADAVSGKFESWVAPDNDTVNQIAGDYMSAAVSYLMHKRSSRDSGCSSSSL